VRVTTAVTRDGEGLYEPLLALERKRVQQSLRAHGPFAGRQEAMNVIDHQLEYPRWLEPFLLAEDADGETYWAELMERRRPLLSTFAPIPPQFKKRA
jgi:hypothetical protein